MTRKKRNTVKVTVRNMHRPGHRDRPRKQCIAAHVRKLNSTNIMFSAAKTRLVTHTRLTQETLDCGLSVHDHHIDWGGPWEVRGWSMQMVPTVDRRRTHRESTSSPHFFSPKQGRPEIQMAPHVHRAFPSVSRSSSSLEDGEPTSTRARSPSARFPVTGEHRAQTSPCIQTCCGASRQKAESHGGTTSVTLPSTGPKPSPAHTSVAV